MLRQRSLAKLFTKERARGNLASVTHEQGRRDLQNAQFKREKVILQQQREERHIFRIRSAIVVKEWGKLSGDLWCSFSVLNPIQPTVVIRTKCQSKKMPELGCDRR
jgi:hypothetical protein